MAIWIHEAVVKGTSYFPVDMLRYDTCYPADTESAMEVTNSEPEPKIVRVQRMTDSKDPRWTVGRWASFGWTCKPTRSWRK